MTTSPPRVLKSKFCTGCSRSRTPEEMRRIESPTGPRNRCIYCIEKRNAHIPKRGSK